MHYLTAKQGMTAITWTQITWVTADSLYIETLEIVLFLGEDKIRVEGNRSRIN
jgi:hypothetical protein